jgi:hypothetical protein
LAAGHESIELRRGLAEGIGVTFGEGAYPSAWHELVVDNFDGAARVGKAAGDAHSRGARSDHHDVGRPPCCRSHRSCGQRQFAEACDTPRESLHDTLDPHDACEELVVIHSVREKPVRDAK